jgi:hypothetical protein
LWKPWFHTAVGTGPKGFETVLDYAKARLG